MRSMKSRRWMILMSCVLALLIARLFILDAEQRAEREEQKNISQEEVMWRSEGELAVMAELENNVAAPHYTVNGKAPSSEGTLWGRTEAEEENGGTQPGTDSALKAGQEEDSSAMEQGGRYSGLYPDMYVSAIDPPELAADDKIAYLTFDDGPSGVTESILNTLDREGIKGTFFILGSTMTEEGEENLKRMAEEGHTIGIHTYSHEYKEIYASVESFLEDFHKVYEQVVELTGVKPAIFRFPWGSYNKYCKDMKAELVAEMERRGFTYYDWNVSAEDSVGKPTAQSILKNVKKDLTKYTKPVILMHDSMNNKLTAQTLPDIIALVKQNGYSFDTLDHREPCQFNY